MKKEFAKQYNHPEWQKIRLKVLERDEFTCQYCGSKTNTLHVHHNYYSPNKNVWEYPIESLITLCSDCHEDYSISCKEYEKKIIESLYNNGVCLHTLDIYTYWIENNKINFKEALNFMIDNQK